ncbi:hypothetical protein DPMN_034154 [Dreissena polymorpha]|uniref:Uncharacterized protein n=1 Tax=Dreissena polymorpha TaxID=45954 RepID=A0A9D4RLT9_DREPO|nr:hypothetical protein DPMN_034154 [Dreissena polymorpha]
METRQKFIPVMKKAREENKEAFLRVDELFIDRREFKPNALEEQGSVVKCVTWNVEGLTADKFSSPEFVNMLSQYDIIFLTETWTN